MSDREGAIHRANNLLDTILKTQPNLLSTKTFSASEGKAAGEFISAPRDRLIAMHQEVPNP